MSIAQEQSRQEAVLQASRPEPALWRDATSSTDPEVFGAAWLTLLGRSQPAIVQAVLFLAPAGASAPAPVSWQIFRSGNAAARDTFEAACRHLLEAVAASKSPLVDFNRLAGPNVLAGWPVETDGSVTGAIVVEAAVADEVSAKRLIRQLQWGAPWVEGFVARQQRRTAADIDRRARAIIEGTREIAGQRGFTAACTALAGHLQRELGCHRVSIGERRGVESRIVAVSQSAAFDHRTELARVIVAAMDEAVDQQRRLAAPHGGGQLAPAQQALANVSAATGVLTVPLETGTAAFGAITLERTSPAEPFSEAETDLAEAISAMAGSMLDEKRRLDMSIPRLACLRLADAARDAAGGKRIGRSLAILAAIVAAVFLSFAEGEYRVTAKVQVQGEQRRILGAPFDGFVKSQYARAGETVREGTVLAQLEDNDLNLDRLRLTARLRQYELELDRALAKRDIAAVSIAQAQIEQTLAEAELSLQMLARTRIKAPFDSVIVSGDLSQSIGRPVSRGDVLFELAPLDRYRVTALVPDTDMQFMKPGLAGSMRLAGLPEQPFDFEVATVTAVARTAEGVNGFEVIGPLRSQDSRIRPGMEGAAKIPVGRHKLVWIWTHELVAWARVKLWAWIP